MSSVAGTEPGGAAATAVGATEAKRTHPKTFIVRGISILSQLAIPLVIASFTILDDGDLSHVIMFVVPALIAIIGVNFLFAYLSWSRLTYTVGEQDIRVDSGVLSRSARSVPYERIQDVSLEQKLVPRLFGLVAVKFETGAGGGEDLSLTFLTMEEGERLRRLVRERRDGAAEEAEGVPAESSAEPAAETLFAMGPNRIFVFGLFEFSLAVFAVLAGLVQYVDTASSIAFWNSGAWEDWIEGPSGVITGLGVAGQVAGIIAGLVAVFIVGSLTGLVRTFLREWEFLLERTARGFRRRRGMLTKTDVVMPVHRVQALKIGTGLIRYRFGWHNLRFVSLAQDAGAANHVVAPFAKMREIEPIVEAAGFSLPADDTDWHRASTKYRIDSMIADSLLIVIAALIAGPIVAYNAPEWTVAVVTLLIGLAVLFAGAALYAWEFKRHALNADQIMSRAGLLSPQSQIATRLKLHSVEIAQGPIARWRGYATLHLGLAGGEFHISGIEIDRARQVRREILKTIAATDFSQLEHG